MGGGEVSCWMNERYVHMQRFFPWPVSVLVAQAFLELVESFLEMDFFKFGLLKLGALTQIPWDL